MHYFFQLEDIDIFFHVCAPVIIQPLLKQRLLLLFSYSLFFNLFQLFLRLWVHLLLLLIVLVFHRIHPDWLKSFEKSDTAQCFRSAMQLRHRLFLLLGSQVKCVYLLNDFGFVVVRLALQFSERFNGELAGVLGVEALKLVQARQLVLGERGTLAFQMVPVCWRLNGHQVAHCIPFLLVAQVILGQP